MVAVLLPGAVEAQREVLEERMGLVEDGEAQDVDPLVRYVVQPQQSEFLQEGEAGRRGRDQRSADYRNKQVFALQTFCRGPQR